MGEANFHSIIDAKIDRHVKLEGGVPKRAAGHGFFEDAYTSSNLYPQTKSPHNLVSHKYLFFFFFFWKIGVEN